VLSMRLRFLTMRERLEEEPEEPEEEPDEEPESTPAPGRMVPSVASDGGREFEYRTELVTEQQVLDGSTLAERLTKASTDGWDLVDIISASSGHTILLRRTRRSERSARPVGFTPPRS
jgi:hypothetical protein